MPQTQEASADERLTIGHTGHGPRVPCRNVRIEGIIGVEHYTKQQQVEWCQQQLQQQTTQLPQAKEASVDE